MKGPQSWFSLRSGDPWKPAERALNRCGSVGVARERRCELVCAAGEEVVDACVDDGGRVPGIGQRADLDGGAEYLQRAVFLERDECEVGAQRGPRGCFGQSGQELLGVGVDPSIRGSRGTCSSGTGLTRLRDPNAWISPQQRRPERGLAGHENAAILLLGPRGSGPLRPMSEGRKLSEVQGPAAVACRSRGLTGPGSQTAVKSPGAGCCETSTLCTYCAQHDHQAPSRLVTRQNVSAGQTHVGVTR